MRPRHIFSWLAAGLILLILSLTVFTWLNTHDFSTLDGDTFRHRDFSNQIVVVNYFAEWCAPCLREIPELNKFYHQAPENVKLFAISYDNLSQQQLHTLKQQYNIEFPIVSEINQNFPFEPPQYLPATYIIPFGEDNVLPLFGEQSADKLLTEISKIKPLNTEL